MARILRWAWVFGVLVAAAAPQSTTHPNVLLVLTDDQGYGDLGVHGNPHLETPVLDRLSREGARFDRFFVSPVCAPTRASLLTGRYAVRTGTHGVTRNAECMRADETTLAEVFRAAGYATGIFGKSHNGAHYPHDPGGQGFDEFVGFCAGHWNDYFDSTLQHNGQPLQTRGYITDVLTDHALGFVERNRDRPFLCYVPYNAPHSPWQVPDRWLDRFSEHDLDPATACAYAMIENIDHNVGRLLDKVDALGLRERTIVLFLTDNGPNTARYNAGMRGRKGSLHEGGVRVPLLVRWPDRIEPGTTIDRIAAHIDLLPTLTDLCGIPSPATTALDGRSLAPLLRGSASSWPDRPIHAVWGGRAAVRTQRHRAVQGRLGWQLHDMAEDPGQQHDLAAAQPAVLARLVAAFERDLGATVARGNAPIPIQVGHAAHPRVTLPAHEAHLHQITGGGIRYAGRAGWAHDWIEGWTDAQAFPRWPIEVTRHGRHAVELLHACGPEDLGATLTATLTATLLPTAGSRTITTAPVTLQRAFPGDALPSRDRIPRKEAPARTWAPLQLGTVELPPGRYALQIHNRGGDTLKLKAVRLRHLGQRPNFIVVLADDMGYGDASCYGGTAFETPHLDRLAAEGLRFTDFHSNGAVCSPTRAALMTGRYPQRAGIPGVVLADPKRNRHHGLHTHEVTFAELLRAAGYATALFGKWHLGYQEKFNPRHHGFDRFGGFVSGNVDYRAHLDGQGIYDWWRDTAIDREATGYTTDLITRDAVAFVEQHRDGPFCLVVTHAAPHYPYQGPTDPPLRTEGRAGQRGSLWDDRDPKHVPRAYAAMMRALDDSVGAILDALRRHGLDQRTMVFFFSDNGATAAGSSGPLRGRKGSLWEGGHRVPAIARWPGTIAPGVTEATAIGMDLMPTLVELAGANPPAERALDGTSLVDLLRRGEKPKERTLFWQNDKRFAARRGRWKLVVGEKALAGKPALFDLDTDQGETEDLSARQPKITAALLAALEAWRRDVRQGATVQPSR